MITAMEPEVQMCTLSATLQVAAQLRGAAARDRLQRPLVMPRHTSATAPEIVRPVAANDFRQLDHRSRERGYLAVATCSSPSSARNARSSLTAVR